MSSWVSIWMRTSIYNIISRILDTGGVGTTTDEQTAMDYWGLVQGAITSSDGSVWLFPCDTPTLPDITLNFASGGSATIKGAMLNLSAQDLGDNSKLAKLNLPSPFIISQANNTPSLSRWRSSHFKSTCQCRFRLFRQLLHCLGPVSNVLVYYRCPVCG